MMINEDTAYAIENARWHVAREGRGQAVEGAYATLGACGVAMRVTDRTERPGSPARVVYYLADWDDITDLDPSPDWEPDADWIPNVARDDWQRLGP